VGDGGTQLSHHDQALCVREMARVLLRLLAVGDVGHRTDIAQEFAIRGVTRHGLVQDPPILAITMADTILGFGRRPRGKGSSDLIAQVRQVVGMHALLPALPGHVFRLPAGEVQPPLADELVAAIGPT
jgi:hypothetical protein